MSEQMIRQLKYEVDTWKRLLAFMMDETVRLKTRLSEVLGESNDESVLEDLEQYQTRFLGQDELVSLLRNDLLMFDQLLDREEGINERMSKDSFETLDKIRKTLKTVADNFTELKLAFNNYLAGLHINKS